MITETSEISKMANAEIDMKFELNDYKQELSDEEILADIKETAGRLNQDYVSISLYRKHGKYSQTAIQNHFGTWRNALRLAGLRTERNVSELKLISDDEYFADLRRVAEIIGQNTVPYDEYRKHGKYSAEHIFHRFKKWNNALELAGLCSTGFSKDKITQQECFDEIERIWRLLGHQPTSTDIINKSISKYSIDTYKRRFGGWRKALESFVEYINEDDKCVIDNKTASRQERPYSIIEEPLHEEHKDFEEQSAHKTSRNINTRLRFKVMKRDNFKCCACGASPAKDPSVELHIDHILPWSKGGETTIDNLQTLCSKCNLGKSDLT